MKGQEEKEGGEKEGKEEKDLVRWYVSPFECINGGEGCKDVQLHIFSSKLVHIIWQSARYVKHCMIFWIFSPFCVHF